jgi:ribosomal protein S6
MDKRNYILYILWKSKIKDEEIKKEIDKFKKVIELGENSISSIAGPKRKRLARPIKKDRECYFTEFGLNIGTDLIKKIEEHFKYDTNILRYMLVRKSS